MSDDRSPPLRASARCITAVLAVVSIGAGSAGAQRATPYDALRDYWVERSAATQARLAEYRRGVSAEYSDTVRTGLVEIVCPRALTPIAAELAKLADSLSARGWTPLASAGRPRFELREREVAPVATSGEAPPGEAPEAEYEIWLRQPDGGGRSLTYFKIETAAEGAAIMVRAGIFEPALMALAPELRAWMDLTPPAERPIAHLWSQAYRDLAAYPSLPARACLVGDIVACETMLALRHEPDPIDAWYDLGLRQTLAARWLAGYRSGRDEADTSLVRSCANGSEAACRRFLSDRMLGANMIEPGAKQLRGLLVVYAFAQGTDSAAQRRAAFASGLTIQERISMAAGRPFADVVRGFRRELVSHQPQPVAPPAPLLWAGAVWFIAFGALSLRSSRWRG